MKQTPRMPCHTPVEGRSCSPRKAPDSTASSICVESHQRRALLLPGGARHSVRPLHQRLRPCEPCHASDKRVKAHEARPVAYLRARDFRYVTSFASSRKFGGRGVHRLARPRATVSRNLGVAVLRGASAVAVGPPRPTRAGLCALGFAP